MGAPSGRMSRSSAQVVTSTAPARQTFSFVPWAVAPLSLGGQPVALAAPQQRHHDSEQTPRHCHDGLLLTAALTDPLKDRRPAACLTHHTPGGFDQSPPQATRAFLADA